MGVEVSELFQQYGQRDYLTASIFLPKPDRLGVLENDLSRLSRS